jgi:hypothetical protein
MSLAAEFCARRLHTVTVWTRAGRLILGFVDSIGNKGQKSTITVFWCRRGISHQMRYVGSMRTTLDINDELLLTVEEIARNRRATAGEVVSALLRDALKPSSGAREYRSGVPLLPRRPQNVPVTVELVNRLRDEDE